MPERSKPINRRNFVAQAAAGSVVAGVGLTTTAQTLAKEKMVTSNDPFNLHFAPHPRMFQASAGKDVIDQIKFSHDQGFTAWEMNGTLSGVIPNRELMEA